MKTDAGRKDTIERVMAMVSPEPNSGCWLWTGSCKPNGYGQTLVKGIGTLAHRVVYTLLRGPIPDGLQLDHLCRVRCCVNPDHLEPVTSKENSRRGLGPLVMSSRTHCPRGHEYTQENTRIYKGRRNCRACHRQFSSAYYYGTLRPRMGIV